MQWLITAALFLLMLAAQATLAPRISLLDARPDFLIVLVVQMALVSPRLDSIVWSWAMGLVADLHDGNPVGVLALTYLLVAVVTQRIRTEIFAGHIVTRLLLVAVADVLRHVALLLAEIARGHPQQILLFFRTTVISVAYTAVVAMVLLPLLTLILKQVYPQGRRS